jgi:Ca2+-binding RTX toxin-like protein
MAELQDIQQYANLALDVYYDTGLQNVGITPGWTRNDNIVADFASTVPFLSVLQSKLGLAVYQKAGQTVIAFDGWEDGILANAGEAFNSVLQLFGFPTSDYTCIGLMLAHYVAQRLNLSESDIYFTGHSQGGATAALVASFYGSDAFIFNPAPTDAAATAFGGLGRVVSVKDENGKIVFMWPMSLGNPYLTTTQEDMVLAAARELAPNAQTLTIEYTSSAGSGSVVEGLRITGDAPGVITTPGAVTDVTDIPIPATDLPFALMAKFHGMNLMRLITYLGMDPANGETWRIQSLNSDLPGLLQQLANSDLYVYPEGYDNIKPQQANPPLSTAEIFARVVVDGHLSGKPYLSLLVQDLSALQNLRHSEDGDAVALAPMLVPIALQIANGNLISSGAVAFFQEETSRFQADLSQLPLVTRDEDPVALKDVPGVAPLASASQQFAGFALIESELESDEASSVVDALQRSVLYEGSYAGLVVASAQKGLDDAASVGVDGKAGTLFIGFERNDKATGGKYDDAFIGNDGGNEFSGGRGNDVITGGHDADRFNGDEGDDIIIAESGADTLSGGDGNDVLVGGLGQDELYGGANDDILYAGGDSDLADGGDGNDLVSGGAGSDTLLGGSGDDTLAGGTGADELLGGKGRDTFVVDDGDIIKDPEIGDRVTYKDEYFLNGGERTAAEARANQPYKGANGEKYQYNDGKLVITLSDGSTVFVEDFINGEAGITLITRPEDPSPFISPLVLDLNGDGIGLTNVKKSGAFFDIDLDGFAEHTGWVSPQDGLLAWDRNGDGSINDIGELFGAGYVAPSISVDKFPYGSSGFQALAQFDDNGDGKVDASDSKFGDLVIWRDLNGDGFSAPGELMTLSQAGITSIDLNYEHTDQTVEGNRITDVSSFTKSDGTTGAVADVWFAYDPYVTLGEEMASPDPEISALPFLKGFGELRNLDVAMAQDPTLRAMVEELANLSLADAYQLSVKVEQIILRWAGVENVSETSRGALVDGQHLAVVEKLMGFQFADGGNPWRAQSRSFTETWHEFFAETTAQLLSQIALGDQLVPGVEFELAAFFVNEGGTTLTNILDAMQAHTPTDPVQKVQYWRSMALVLDGMASALPDTDEQIEAAVDARLATLGVGFQFGELRTADFASGNGDTAIETLIHGTVLMGDEGDNVLSGFSGYTKFLIGKNQGNDRIVKAWGNSEVHFLDLLPSDVTFRVGDDPLGGDLVAEFSGGSVTIVGQYLENSSLRPAISRFVFEDGTSMDWTDIQVGGLSPTDGADLLIGKTAGSVLAGGLGNDTLRLGFGDDTVQFNLGDGVDLIKAIYGSIGTTDQLQFGPGITEDDIKITLANDDLFLKVGSAGDEIRITGQFGYISGTFTQAEVIDEFVFADGTKLTANQVRLLGLAGTSGSDSISGSSRNDTIEGGAGNDTLAGGVGDDTYLFNRGDGFDTIADGDGSNVLAFGSGIDSTDLVFSRIAGTADVLVQLSGTQDAIKIAGFLGRPNSSIQEIHFANGSSLTRSEITDLLPIEISETNVSTAFDYWLTPAGIDDFYELGGGRDVIGRFDANDVVLFGRGSGYDTVINEGVGSRTVQFATGVTPDDIVIEAGISDWGVFDGDAYDFWIKGTSDHLLIMYGGVSQLLFADGTVWTWQQALDRYYAGSDGDDHIVGNDDPQILDGGVGGNDTLDGWGGDDSYVFGRGYGSDTIAGWGANNTTDKVIFGDGLSVSDLSFSLIKTNLGWGYGTGLRVTINDTGDSLTVEMAQHVDQYVFKDGTILSREDVIALANSGNDFVDMDTLTDTRAADPGAGDDVVYDTNWHDTIEMSAGDDLIYGSDGNDTYLFSLGDGQDVIVETGTVSSTNDRLVFGPGIAAANVSATFSGYDLVLSINGTADRVTIKSALDLTAASVDKIEFSDGTAWTPAQLLAAMNSDPSGDNLLSGLTEYDGQSGNDRLVGGTSDDVYHFDAGYDHDTLLDLGGADDRVIFGAGIAAENLRALRAADGQSLKLEFAGLSDTLTIEGGVEVFEFSDGTKLSFQQVMQPLLDKEATSGSDTIVGIAGDLVLDGRGGNDNYVTATGNTVAFSPGSGNDTIPANVTGVSVRFADGITPDSVLLDRIARSDGGANLVIGLRGQTDTLTIEDQFTAAHQIGSFVFSDGTVWSQTDMQKALLAGKVTARDDYLIGSDGNDVVDGGAGNDTITGGKGDDTYKFGYGSGRDTIRADAPVDWYGPSAYGADRVLFGPGITLQNLTITSNGASSITINLPGGADSLTIELARYDWEALVALPISRLEFADGSSVSSADLLAQVYSATDGDDVLTTATFEWYGGNEYDGAVYDGGAGNDLLIGAGGADVYAFGRGYGTDTVVEEGFHYQLTGGEDYVIPDVVQFTADVAPGDIKLLRGGLDLNDLIIEIVETGDRLIVRDQFDQFAGLDVSADAQRANQWLDGIYFDGTTTVDQLGYIEFMHAYSCALGVDELQFADGTVWNREQIAAMVSGTELAEGDNTIRSSDSGGTLDGGTGNDALLGGKGDDVYIFGRGYAEDQILDAGGADIVEFKDIALSDVMFSRVGASGGDLLIEVDGLERLTLTILNQFGEETTRIEKFTFSDGVEVTWADIQATILTQQSTEDANRILGFGTDDSLNGLGGADTLIGCDGNDTLNGGLGADTLIGGPGNDLYAVDNSGDSIVEAAGEGVDTVTSSISWALGQNVENLTLSGSSSTTGIGNDLDNVLIGNSASNSLSGGAGNDTLNGKGGADTLIGGAGNDTYVVDNIGDVVVELAGEGIDLVQSSISYNLGATLENLTLTGSANLNGIGNALDNIIIGNQGSNQITGAGGDDVLDGGAGIDTLVGGTGSDVYVVDNPGDQVIEQLDEGIDTVRSSVSWSLGANLERLELTGSMAVNGTGNGLDNILIGNSAANQLSGGAGNDTLDGAGGADYLVGGLGDDIYIVDASADVIAENAGEGTDKVYSSASYSLSANIEELDLTGTAAINGTGNALNNVIVGNSASNVLDGSGGADTLIGGAGSDTYVLSELADVVIEDAGEGIDTIQVGFSYTLGANLENLTLTGTDSADGVGNELVNILVGNASANRLDGGIGTDVLSGGAGDDTYVVDNAGDLTIENPNEGIDTVESTISWTLSADVENLKLLGASAIDGTGNSQANTLTGNMAANKLSGGGGDDVLDGGIGADTLTGGAGNDVYVVEDAGDVVSENANEGTDTVQSTISYALGSNVENLVLEGDQAINGTGNGLNNLLIGNSSGNQLNGGSGNDTLDGAAGADTLAGGTGNDTYVVDDAGDVVVENAGEGTDLVQSAITYVLGANVENLSLIGSAAIDGTGNTFNNNIVGNTAGNSLAGAAGNDTLDGGAGADTLVGGSGNDVYVVDDETDIVLENAGEGIDSIQSSVTYALTDNVENLTLVGGAAINGTGNGMDNMLTGNAAGNQLSAGAGNDTLNGGAGADTLIGGVGNDSYIVDDSSDFVVEGLNEGVDLVQSSITYALTANVENLTLTGSSAIDGTGNELDNALTGNSGSNQLFGGAGDDTLNGGAAADTLIGGAGNDTYVVDNVGDVTTETAGEGTDTVQSSITWTLSAEIENLTLTGSSAISGTGNALDNAITGNSGANQLTGGAGNDTLNGGTGADTLIGGTGDDVYVVDNAGDVTTEAAGEGTDLVQSSITWTLAANVENLTLTGSSAINGTGNALDNILTGNSGNNQLTGGTGNDRLDGGAGNDTMTGGLGDDVYVVQAAGDLVNENAGEGIDTIESSITISSLVNNVENLTLTGTSAINGTGNGLDNIITGNSAANSLDGGIGADTLIGGAGNDTYAVDNAGDVTTENAGEGTDTVQSSITWTLSGEIENLTLTGTSAINGTGNELDNTIVGNSGANQLSGGAGNDTLNGGTGADTLIGGAGDDIYVVDNAGDVVTENAGEGTDLIQSSVTYTLSANVENLTLTGTSAINGTGNELDNAIVGNSGANQLSGGAGNDTLNGSAGADTLIGGTGDDIYVVDNAGDVVTENAGEGIDLVQSSVTYTLSANVENLTLTGSSAINGTGNALDNVLTGNTSNNTLDGGVGADTLIGGAGNDTYVVDNTGDVVTENAGEGADLVQSSVTYALSANVENLTLTGTAAINGTGNELDNAITGNSGANQLTGAAGNDTLNGSAGADTLIGGTGDDIYVVDSAGDVVTENAGEGTDLIQSSVTYTLSANVENLTLTGSSAINGTGNSLDNVVTGNSGANVLDGGIGADTLAGGAGNDTYVVDSANDVVVENASQGTDLVQSSVTYALSANVENLTLTGTAAINGTGNALDNVLTGNTAANQLTGGAGNDTYVVDNVGDTTVENAGEGTDLVQSSITWTLAANVENLTLTGSSTINGTGNELDNVITGNSGANQLTGGAGNDTLNGGTGADTLIGGTGDDLYVVDNAGDVVTENAGEGTDLVQSSVTYTLSANVENLTLTGSSAINGTGNGLDNVLTGNSGANVLDGGIGADTLAGGAGNDTYIVDNANDVIVESASQGTDTVQSSITYTLAANVENLTLTGASAINGTGNALDNVLTGNTGANQLTGGAGNDTYVVDNAGDTTIENAGEGIDLVQSSISWTLAANVENLTLTGTAAINGTGNALDNAITGNSGANQLTGGAGNDTLNGGTGADTLIGGTGDDVYVVDNAGDVTTEAAGEGTDLVQSSITWTLAANVENLTLTGSSAINGTGNALDNILTGNSGNNQLTGGAGNDRLDGGAGNDTMTGGLGDDAYVVQAAGDVVTENAGEGTDTIESSITISSLANNVENLTLTGTSAINGTGNGLDNVIIGNTAANSLTGGAGNDTLDGGLGADTLIGGTGNDTFIVDNSADAITENAGEGTDLVQSSISWTLGSQLENLTLTGSAAINGTGNALSNILLGNSGINVLTGLDGNDTLDGGAGNDTLVGGQGADEYRFGRGGGADAVDTYDTDGGADLLSIGSGVADDQLWFARSGDDLVMTIIGTNDTVTVQGWYASTDRQLNQIQLSNGEYAGVSDVDQLVAAMASYSPPPLGQTTLSTDVKQALSSTLAASWHS